MRGTRHGRPRHTIVWVACLAAALCTSAIPPAVAAGPEGSLDAGFAIGGKVLTSFGPGDDVANAVALQPDGKIITAG